MKLRHPLQLLCCASLCAWPGVATAQLQILPAREPQRVFSGAARPIALVFSNAGNQTITADLRARLVQTSSTTAVPVGETPWKKLSVLPGQTVLEAAALDFPDVRAETRFLVQWLEGTSQATNQIRSSGREPAPSETRTSQSRLTSAATVIATTDVLGYPTNLLADLKSLLADDDAMGVLDPQNQLKPLLSAAKVECLDLGEASLDEFRGRLAVIGPFASKEQMPANLAARIQTIARKGVAVVWMQPPLDKRAKLQPSFYSVPFGDTAVVVVQSPLVAGLADNPQSQLNLVRFCELALRPEPPQLPHLPENP